MFDLILTLSIFLIFSLLGYQLYELYKAGRSIKRCKTVLHFMKKRGEATEALKEFGELLVKLRLANDRLISTIYLNRLVNDNDSIEKFKYEIES